jgi:hypothetical protein
MERQGLFPEKKAQTVNKGLHRRDVERYDVYILLTGRPLAFCYECRGVIREYKNTKNVFSAQYTVAFFRGTGVTEANPIIDHARILSISNLLYRFQMKLSHNTP